MNGEHTMRRTLLVAVVTVALVAALAPAAGAITGNYQRDFTHTGVGLLVTYDDDGEFAGRCSGTLLDERFFLTAAHCTAGKSSARIYFEQAAGANYDPALGIDPQTGYPEEGGVEAAKLHTPEQYDDFASFPNTWDVALVELAEGALGEAYEGIDWVFGELPEEGALTALAARSGKRHVSFTVSGYGVTWINPAQVVSLRERLMATATLTNLQSSLADGYNLAHSGNPGRGRGGTCFGDSGGPVFLSGTTTIMGVTSFGLSAQTCTGPGFAYRTDQPAVLDWITTTMSED
jgi:hypothetical protein